MNEKCEFMVNYNRNSLFSYWKLISFHIQLRLQINDLPVCKLEMSFTVTYWLIVSQLST